MLVAGGGTFELDKVTVSDNVASSGGGVAVSANGPATVKGSTFALNRRPATGVGGGRSSSAVRSPSSGRSS